MNNNITDDFHVYELQIYAKEKHHVYKYKYAIKSIKENKGMVNFKAT